MADDILQTRRNIRELTKVGEREIHEVVLSCTRSRRQILNSVPTTKPTPTDRSGRQSLVPLPDGFPTNWWIKWM